jgi:hypothetical protein
MIKGQISILFGKFADELENKMKKRYLGRTIVSGANPRNQNFSLFNSCNVLTSTSRNSFLKLSVFVNVNANWLLAQPFGLIRWVCPSVSGEIAYIQVDLEAFNLNS